MTLRKIWLLAYMLTLNLFMSRSAFANINEFSNKFMTLRLYAEIPSYNIEIKSKVAGGQHVVWAPNLRALTGADVSINNFLAIGYSWANNDDPGSAQKKGVTEYQDYRLGLTLKHLHAQANYQHFHGFYLDNTMQVEPSHSTNSYIQDTSLVAGNYSLNMTFILSPEKFSYTAALGQDARQEASGGSWLLGLAASDTYFSNDTGLIPSQVRGRYGEDQNVKTLDFYSLIAKFGYGYTIAWSKKWFTSALLEVGLGGEYRSVKDSTRQTTTGGGATKADALFSTGFNGDDFLMAIILTGDMTTYTTQSLEIPSTIGDFKLAIGGHF